MHVDKFTASALASITTHTHNSCQFFYMIYVLRLSCKIMPDVVIYSAICVCIKTNLNETKCGRTFDQDMTWSNIAKCLLSQKLRNSYWQHTHKYQHVGRWVFVFIHVTFEFRCLRPLWFGLACLYMCTRKFLLICFLLMFVSFMRPPVQACRSRLVLRVRNQTAMLYSGPCRVCLAPKKFQSTESPTKRQLARSYGDYSTCRCLGYYSQTEFTVARQMIRSLQPLCLGVM